jgi:hypothetical protein
MNDELADRLTALEARVDGLTRHLHTITRSVVQRLDDDALKPVRWRDLSPDACEARLAALRGWGSWLRTRYALDQKSLPWCWDRHGALIEELGALCTAWTAAFAATGNPMAPSAWHDTLARTLARLREWGARSGCRPGEHRDDIIIPDPLPAPHEPQRREPPAP